MTQSSYSIRERDAVYRVIQERRDVRDGYTDVAIPDDVLTRILAAGHAAPSIGLTKPWDFVVIKSQGTRRKIREKVVQERHRYARTLPAGRAELFNNTKIEAILDTPVNIAVTYDETRGGIWELGSRTKSLGGTSSVCMAIENIWLAARAEGIGLNQVGFLDNDEIAGILNLPPHISLIGYLCLGYVDEFPEPPELVLSGWARSRPLDWVVHNEKFGSRGLPGQAPKDALADAIEAASSGDGVRDNVIAVDSLPQPATAAIFLAEHGFRRSADIDVLSSQIAHALSVADDLGVEALPIAVGMTNPSALDVDVLVRTAVYGTKDIREEPALTKDEVRCSTLIGLDIALDLVTAGNASLMASGLAPGVTYVSSLIASSLAGEHIQHDLIADRLAAVRRDDPLTALEAIGGVEHAALVGFLLGAAAMTTPVLLNGPAARVAAQIVNLLAPGSGRWFVDSREGTHQM